MKKIMWRTFVVALVLVFGIAVYDGLRPTWEKIPVQTEPETPQVAATNYKLVLEANPSFNSQQTFSPPTNSVVITNKEQLGLLLEQHNNRKQ